MVTDAGIIGPKGQPAILTYFGQFIDHDITLNTDSDPDNLPAFSIANEDGSLTRNSREAVLETIKNGRIASLRLDSLYGDDEAIEPFLRDGAKMKIGRTTSNRPNDLPRMADLPAGNEFDDDPNAPIIGDARNDENLIVAQLHLAFLRFHNAIVDQLDPTLSDEERFQAAKRQTILTYQWLVLNDYCAALCVAGVLADALNAPAAESYRGFSQGAQIMPLEFSVAAFRFGHSMIRPEYHFNRNFGPNGELGRAPLSELFRFTGSGGLAGASRLSDLWVIDWNNFLPAGDEERAARGIDSTIAEGLDQLVLQKPELLPVPVREALRHLPARNLRRSYVLAIPTAQQVLADLSDDAA
ncbi:MAG: peroxidase family protein, partial [Marinomonas sp.]